MLAQSLISLVSKIYLCRSSDSPGTQTSCLPATQLLVEHIGMLLKLAKLISSWVELFSAVNTFPACAKWACCCCVYIAQLSGVGIYSVVGWLLKWHAKVGNLMSGCLVPLWLQKGLYRNSHPLVPICWSRSWERVHGKLVQGIVLEWERLMWQQTSHIRSHNWKLLHFISELCHTWLERLQSISNIFPLFFFFFFFFFVHLFFIPSLFPLSIVQQHPAMIQYPCECKRLNWV